jgi:hypothetical protein
MKRTDYYRWVFVNSGMSLSVAPNVLNLKNYRSFIVRLMRQLPATKRKLAGKQYEELENDGGEYILYY